MKLKPQALYDLIDSAVHALHPMPRRSLTGGQRMRRAGYFFEGDGEFVALVGAAVRAHRHLFPDVPQDPDEMIGGIDRAGGFLALHQALSDLAARAWDNYLVERSDAVKGALDVVKQVRAEAQGPLATPFHKQRQQALLPAEDKLAERKLRDRRKGQQRKRAAARAQEKAGPPAPARTGPAKKPLSPQRKAIKLAARAEMKSFVDRLEIGPPPGPGPEKDAGKQENHLQTPPRRGTVPENRPSDRRGTERGTGARPITSREAGATRKGASGSGDGDRLLRRAGDGPAGAGPGPRRPGRGTPAAGGRAARPGGGDERGQPVDGAAPAARDHGAAGGDGADQRLRGLRRKGT